MALTSHTWTGAASALWSDAGNWTGGAPTEPGAVVEFPAGASHLTNTNDLSNVSLQSILFSGRGYRISGNPVALSSGITTATGSTGLNTFNPDIELAGSPTFLIDNARAAVVLGGSISGSFDLTKSGEGELVLSGTNTYSGVTTVEGGILDVQNASALGQAVSGTLVESGATLQVEGGISLAEPLTLSGPGFHGAGALNNASSFNLWTAPITLNSQDASIHVSDGTTLTLRGVLNGPGGLTKQGLGNLVFGAFVPNTYAGTTTFAAGTVLLDETGGVAIPGPLVIGASGLGSSPVTVTSGRDNQVAATASLTIQGGSELQLANHSNTFGSILLGGGIISTGTRGELDLDGDLSTTPGSNSTIFGIVSLGSSTRTATIADGSTLTIPADISGAAGLIKQGPGVLLLSGVASNAGTATVNAGILRIDGTYTSSVVVHSGGVLGGVGTVGAVLGQGGVIAPDGTFTINGDCVLGPGSALQADLKGFSAGTGYGQLIVDGGVRLEGGELDVVVGFTPLPGSLFTIVKKSGNSPLAGAFARLPQGAIFDAGGQVFRISYSGGGGADIVLTDLAASSVRLMGSATTLAYGQPLLLKAVVPSASVGVGIPTGTVTFFDGRQVLGRAPLQGGSAVMTTAALTSGRHSITAVYGGDGSYAPSPASAPLDLTVQPASTQMLLTITPSAPPAGLSVRLTATVVSQTTGVTPIGAVSFFDGASYLGTAALQGGVATLRTVVLGPGNHTLSARYSGTVDFRSSDALLTNVAVGTRDQVFVNQVYEVVLGRAAEPAGLAYWTGLLHRGVSRARIVFAIEHSVEGRLRRRMERNRHRPGHADQPG